MFTTTTVHWNSGSPAKGHNERDKDICSHEEHIDLKNIHGNSFHETLYRQDLTEAYREIFGEAIDEFNAKQTRKDRIKSVESYMDEVVKDTRGKRQTKRVNGKRVVDEQARRGKQLEYEITVKVGSTEREKDELGRTVYDADGHHVRTEELPRELQLDILREYCNTFQENNPNFKVTGIEMHGDEGFYNAKGVWEYAEIHPHITFIPVAGGFKQGLSVQNSMNKALDAMGCGGADGYDKWAKKEQERLETIVLQKYKEYCLEHQDFAMEHGELTIHHPVHDELKQGDMDKEQFVREKHIEEKIGLYNSIEQSVTERQQQLDTYREELTEFKDEVSSDLKLMQQQKSRLDAEKAEFEAYKASQLQTLEERDKSLTEAFNTLKDREYALWEAERDFKAHKESETRAISNARDELGRYALDLSAREAVLADSADEVKETLNCAIEYMQYECPKVGNMSAYAMFNRRLPSLKEAIRTERINAILQKHKMPTLNESLYRSSRGRDNGPDYDI